MVFSMPDKAKIESLKKQYLNKRIKLVFTYDDYTELRRGNEGVVYDVDAVGQLQIKWDCGSTLAMIPGIDVVSIIS